MQAGGISGYRLEINTTPGKLTIRNKSIRFRAKSNGVPKMHVEVKRPNMSVDWDSYWAQVGRKTAKRLMESQVAESKQAVTEGIARVASEGDQMMDITKSSPKNAMALMSFDKLNKPPIEISSGMMPQEAPKIEWENGSISITWDQPQFELDWDTDYRPDIEYTPCVVEISFRPNGTTKIAINEKKVAKPIGKKVNTTV